MKQKQSAKDLAFEKERVKFRKKIRELESEINDLQLAVMQKDNELNIVRNELSQKEDWIRRLLEYTELSENDMKAIIDKEKSVATAMKRFGELGNILVSGMGMIQRNQERNGKGHGKADGKGQ